jgi:hypothetical protein
MIQRDMVLNALRHRPGGLTALDALRDFGCMRLGARVWELKRDGHRVESELVEVETRDGTARVARYRLAP